RLYLLSYTIHQAAEAEETATKLAIQRLCTASKPPSLQASKPPSLQASKPPSLQASKPPSLQASKPPSLPPIRPHSPLHLILLNLAPQPLMLSPPNSRSRRNRDEASPSAPLQNLQASKPPSNPSSFSSVPHLLNQSTSPSSVAHQAAGAAETAAKSPLRHRRNASVPSPFLLRLATGPTEGPVSMSVWLRFFIFWTRRLIISIRFGFTFTFTFTMGVGSLSGLRQDGQSKGDTVWLIAP
ncbi:hypothetical protein AK830_g11006, partial [Neonectria ditissima]